MPPAVVARADELYRLALSPVIPLCADDAIWREELARACVLQLLMSAPRVLDAAVGDDEPWGTARHRERLLHWLRTCLAMLEGGSILPGVQRTLKTWTRTVETGDTGRGALVPYAAFAPPRPPVRLAMAVVLRDGRVLMQRRWRRGIGFVHEFPGGRADDGESWANAACRELREETGLVETIVVRESVAPSRDGGTVAFVVLDLTTETPPRATSAYRHQTFEWFSPPAIPLADLAPADAAFVRDELPEVLDRWRDRPPVALPSRLPAAESHAETRSGSTSSPTCTGSAGAAAPASPRTRGA